jgi:hypothetical protein
MSVALALLLSATAPSQTTPAPPPNLAFRSGTLEHWQGEGFFPTSVSRAGPDLNAGATSSDNGRAGRKAVLHRTFRLPAHVVAIRFRAAAVRRRGLPDGPTLDAVLEATQRRIIPKRVRAAAGWEPAEALLPLRDGQLREYEWNVEAFAGENVRIALLDQDDRPGCYVACSGFRFVTRDEVQAGRDEANARAFGNQMLALAREHHLPPPARIDTRHFLAVSTAPDDYTEHRLYNCETIYELFFPHFRGRGFAVREPREKLMVAIFDSQAGFEAYLGGRMPSVVAGLYHPPTNRLVVYDLGTNRAFEAARERGKEMARSIPAEMERKRVLSAFGRQAENWRNDTNLSTIMHETAHQLSFNCGLLNRDGDVAAWLAEGLACYCEATAEGSWQGPGEANPARAAALARALRDKAPLIPLKELIESDDWLRKATTVEGVLLGYGQSWALFRMLMEERPQALKKYLAAIYSRRTPEHRLADFAEAFGADLGKLEARHREYVRAVVKEQVRPGR